MTTSMISFNFFFYCIIGKHPKAYGKYRDNPLIEERSLRQRFGTTWTIYGVTRTEGRGGSIKSTVDGDVSGRGGGGGSSGT